jgi:hypothetical protein
MNDERRPAKNAAATNQPPSSVSAPAVVIWFELEAAPVVQLVAEHEGDISRLVDWLSLSHWAQNPLCHELVELLERRAA